jgi:carboxymethylenebutenolidase
MSASSEGRLGSDVDLTSEARGYLAVPASGHGPGVVVIQEWWGLVDHIRDVCDRLAREGFVALAPDLYRGSSAGDPDEAQRLMMDLDIPRADSDLGQAVARLLNHDAVEGARIGCIGFCMGGQLALYAATHNPRIGAVVDCYGIHPNVELDLSQMKAAVLGVFAENDDFVPHAAVRKLDEELSAAGVRAHLETYIGVDHAFLNDSRPDVYDAATSRAAWNDILAFLRAELV